MSRALDVYLHSDFIGHLIQNEHGEMVFTYAESWLENPQAMPLSHSLPLRKEAFSRNECRGFFAGILPEESKRELVARNLGISARNDFAMIEQIGGECAGAVTFIPAGEKLPAQDYQYKPLPPYPQSSECIRRIFVRHLVLFPRTNTSARAGLLLKTALNCSGMYQPHP